MDELLYKDESKTLLGLAMLLHRELGCGFKEKIYQDAYEVLLKEHNIPYEREKHMKMVYHGIELKHDYYYDFLCYDKICVEVKANSEIFLGIRISDHQLHSYWESPLGTLIKFRYVEPSIQILSKSS